MLPKTEYPVGSVWKTTWDTTLLIIDTLNTPGYPKLLCYFQTTNEYKGIWILQWISIMDLSSFVERIC